MIVEADYDIGVTIRVSSRVCTPRLLPPFLLQHRREVGGHRMST